MTGFCYHPCTFPRNDGRLRYYLFSKYIDQEGKTSVAAPNRFVFFGCILDCKTLVNIGGLRCKRREEMGPEIDVFG